MLRINANIAHRWKEWLLGYGFLLPALTLFGAFLFYPLLQSVYLSLHMTDARGRIAKFVGVDHFVSLLTDSRFYDSLIVTAKFTLYTVPTGIVIALLIAVLAHVPLRGMKLFHFSFSLPMALSAGTASVIWLLLFHPSAGMFNYMLSLFGLEPVGWLTDPKQALASVSLMTVWLHLGFNFIVLLSALQGIPPVLLESARIDGVKPLQMFRSILVPMLSPTLFFLTIVSIIGSFQTFGQIHILTGGGPARSTEVLVYAIYQDAFVNFRFGTGSAQALVLFALILLLTWIQFRVAERRVHYQ
ncbi:carbohydrate ABC transporter permease [Xylanibacillus composti]|uniref:Glycerol-3-phosphate ABC transporter permease n=1 Tax=Xylanibacillus composti TaxID=1572762 RepID=A0A8J4M3F2_9BACL|nr:sugar ABC transporter permease [Xylanibacillus composti]GIQ69471.1 glycerol-3-phosphate ABC transporter permease [Xylanibacillus composti]